ncbi:MAG: hypothetical protein Phog2KO_27360 [Phototrophicaceae bacterium]
MTKLRILFLLIAVFVLALPLQAQDVDVDEIIFARGVASVGYLPIQADDVFPDSIEVVYAIISGDGLEEGDEFDIVWFFDGDELDSFTYENNSDSDEFRTWASWSDPDGLEDGDWELQIVYDGDVIAEGEFEITNDEYIYPITFGENCNIQSTELVAEDTDFQETLYLYALIEHENFDNEMVKILWVIDGEVIDFDIEFEIDDDGSECVFLQNGGDFIPDGEYGLIVEGEDGNEYVESEAVEVQD